MRRSTFVMAMFGLAALLHVVFACAAFPTTVNYQGELRENGVPREGTVDLVFYVFDEAGTHVQTLVAQDVPINRGLFTAALNFDPETMANAQNYQLQIAVRDGASTGGYQPLEPRQPLTSVPFAINARTVDGLSATELQGGAAIKSTNFASTGIPDYGEPAIALSSLSIVAPSYGNLLARGRGWCFLADYGELQNIVELSIGTDVADAFGSGTSAGPIGAELSKPLNGTEVYATFTTERVYPMVKGMTKSLGLFGKHAAGTDVANCQGTFTVEFFPGSL